ncbi:MAG: hypothetical protein M3Y56_16990 [Armatimonadota bacterium]|nr:hypothetical protein [Armatimonadota bacterium]
MTHFKVVNASVPSCVAALSSHIGFRCGLEDAPCRGVSLAALRTKVSLDVHDMAVRTILDQLVARNPAFTWNIEKSGLVHLAPAGARKDRSYRPNWRLPGYPAEKGNQIEATSVIYFALNTGLPRFTNRFVWTEPMLTDELGNPLLFTFSSQSSPIYRALDALSAQVKGSWYVQWDGANEIFEVSLTDERGFNTTLPEAIVEYAGPDHRGMGL